MYRGEVCEPWPRDAGVQIVYAVWPASGVVVRACAAWYAGQYVLMPDSGACGRERCIWQIVAFFTN